MDYQQRQAPRDEQGGKGSGLGGLWLLLAPAACCGGPLIIGALAAAGVLAWGAVGLGVALVTAVAVILVARRRRRSRACCPPVPADTAQPADRSPAR